jgi:hypothetical protein
MGYDTSLEIDGRGVLLWRKHASSFPRLLFQHDQLVVEDLDDGKDHEDEDPSRGGVTVQYRATVQEVLATLDEVGLGWDATVAAYAETRIEGTSVGLVMAMAISAGADPAETEKRIAEFRGLGPHVDLGALGVFLSHQWGDSDVHEIALFKDINYDGSIESISSNSLDVYHYTISTLEGVNACALVRAVESWCNLYREARLLAWPMLLCVLLQHLSPTATVVLDLTDDAREEGVRTTEEAGQYAANYWTWTSEGLASSARTIGRLFSVLASFDSMLGREFWFARASVLYARLLSLSDVGVDATTKARGDALETLIEALLRTEEPELEVIERNFRTREEEIDVLVANGLEDPFWIAHGSPLVLIECKNTKDKVGVPDLRILESKIRDRGALCKVGIFVSMAGFADTFLERLKQFQAEGGVIFAVSGADLKQLISSKTRLSRWLRGPGVIRSLGKQAP